MLSLFDVKAALDDAIRASREGGDCPGGYGDGPLGPCLPCGATPTGEVTAVLRGKAEAREDRRMGRVGDHVVLDRLDATAAIVSAASPVATC